MRRILNHLKSRPKGRIDKSRPTIALYYRVPLYHSGRQVPKGRAPRTAMVYWTDRSDLRSVRQPRWTTTSQSAWAKTSNAAIQVPTMPDEIYDASKS